MRYSQFLLKGLVCLVTFTGALSAQSVALLTGPEGTSTAIPVFNADSLAQVTTVASVPQGAFQMLSKPDGTKFYIISNAPGAGITAVDQNFGDPRQVATAITSPPVRAAVSPDGRRLVVLTDTSVFVLETTNDTILNIGGFDVSGSPIDVAFGHDSRTAYVVSYSTLAAHVTRIGLDSPSAGTALTISLNTPPTGISTSPTGLVYLTVQNALHEIDPQTLTLNTNRRLFVTGTPGKVSFTPNGQYAIAANRSTFGAPAVVFDLVGRTVTAVTGASVPTGTLDGIIVAGNQRILAHSSLSGGLYDVSLTGTLTQSTFALTVGTVRTVAISGESSARTLFLTAVSEGENRLYRVDLNTSAVNPTQPVVPNEAGQILQFLGVNPRTGGASMQGFNTEQTLTSGAALRPLVARVFDSAGRPVFGAQVTFSSTQGVTLSSTSASTNSQGYAQVTATQPSTAGTYTVQASIAGGASVTYTLTVPGSGGGGGESCPECEAGISILSGNGQLVPSPGPAAQLLMVVARDESGAPVTGQLVNFLITLGPGTLQCPLAADNFPYIPTGTCAAAGEIIEVATDTNGRAAVKFTASAIIDTPLDFTTVTASSATASVDFSVVTLRLPEASPVITLLAPQPDPTTSQRIIRGRAGETIENAIQVQIVRLTAGGQSGIPNVGLNVGVTGDPASVPSASCAGGIPLTNSAGVATCDVVLGSVATSVATPLVVNVGGVYTVSQIAIIVDPGGPSTIEILEGNNTTGNPGQQILLRARVNDPSGNPNPSVATTWQVTQGTATLSQSSTQTNASGVTQTTVTLGATPGNVNVRLTAGTGANAVTANFTLTISSPVGGISVVSGNEQAAVVNTQFGQPLVVRVVNSTQQPVSGAQVTFAVTSGAATVGTATVTSDSDGRASTTVTAGSTAGPIVITATSGTQNVQFTLTSRLPGPILTAESFRNGASSMPGLTPCGIAIVSGPGLATGIQGTVEANPFVGPLPFSLSGVSIDINGIPAPIFWVSNTQQGGEAVAFQTPCDVSPGLAEAVIRVNGGDTTVSSVPVSKYQPGIFDTTVEGRRYAVLLHEDGSYVTPENPAQRGETLKMFTTGMGPVSPMTGTNQAGTGDQIVTANIAVGVNNQGVLVKGAEYLEGAIGIYVITFEVPIDTQAGDYQNLGLIVWDPADPETPIYALGSFLRII